MNNFEETAKKIDEYFEQGNNAAVLPLIKDLKNEDIAEILNNLDDDNKVVFIKILDIEDAAAVLSEVSEAAEHIIVENMDTVLLSDIIEVMEKDDAVDLIQNLDEEAAKKVFDLIARGYSQKIKDLLKYPEDSAGGLMTTDYISLRGNMTTDEAIGVFRERETKTKIFHAYVIDKLNRLVGVVSLRKLITSQGRALIKDIMLSDVVKVRTYDDQENVAHKVSKYNLLAIPVVDALNRLAGIVTVDDVIDVINQEATEDIYKMAGTSYDELESGSIFTAAKFRLPWLVVTLFGEMVSGWILKSYNVTLGQVLILASFIPVIMAMGGNVGNQCAIVVVRGLATGRISAYHIWKSILHEIGTGAIIGVISGVTVGLIAQLWQLNIYLGFIIAITMFIGMIIAATVGSLLPIIFTKTGIDPAIATGPFVTTFNDVLGLFVYFSTATLFFQYLTK